MSADATATRWYVRCQACEIVGTTNPTTSPWTCSACLGAVYQHYEPEKPVPCNQCGATKIYGFHEVVYGATESLCYHCYQKMLGGVRRRNKWRKRSNPRKYGS